MRAVFSNTTIGFSCTDAVDQTEEIKINAGCMITLCRQWVREKQKIQHLKKD